MYLSLLFSLTLTAVFYKVISQLEFSPQVFSSLHLTLSCCPVSLILFQESGSRRTAQRMFVKPRASAPAVYSSVVIHSSVCSKSKFSFLITVVAMFLQPSLRSFFVRGYGDRTKSPVLTINHGVTTGRSCNLGENLSH